MLFAGLEFPNEKNEVPVLIAHETSSKQISKTVTDHVKRRKGKKRDTERCGRARYGQRQ